MITKFAIVCLCMTSSVMCGLIYTKSKKRRANYFASCVRLTDKLIADISFRKENLLTILKEFAATDQTELAANINTYCEKPFDKSEIATKILKQDERARVGEFFDSLGGSDSDTQLFELRNYSEYFASKLSDEELKLKKSGNIGLKLSALFGLAVGILIL